jgi:hypothetical protein
LQTDSKTPRKNLSATKALNDLIYPVKNVAPLQAIEQKTSNHFLLYLSTNIPIKMPEKAIGSKNKGPETNP